MTAKYERSRLSAPAGLRESVREANAPTARPSAPQVEHSSLLELQRLVGNAAASRLLGNEGGSLRQMVASAVQAPDAAPLPATVRAQMEPVLGQDLGDVQVRTDRTSTEALDARAYTLGNDIVVHPGDAGGGASTDRILAHEAVHVAQQRSGPVSGRDVGGVAVSEPGDSFEREAERLSSGSAGTEAATTAGHGEALEQGVALQRFPATALSAPAPWQALTGSVARPGEGVSGGIYILTSREEQPQVKTVVVKPIFGSNGLGTTESSAQMTFGDRAIASLFGIRTPTSRGVPKGSPEFEQLVAVCSPKAPPRPGPDEPGASEWQALSEAKSFVVMAEVPKGSSISSLAKKAGTDHEANDRLHATVFNDTFLRQLGRLCIADLLLGNNDRMVAKAMNLGNLMVSPGGQDPELWAIDSNAVLGKFDPQKVLSGGSASGSINAGFGTTQTTLDKGPAHILDGFFEVVAGNMKDPDQGSDELRLGPGEILKLTYEGKRAAVLAAFEEGWNSGLETVRALVETKTGRKKMKGLTEEVSDEQGAENVRYTTLKTNALYLGAKAKGASHDEAARDPATYGALKLLAEFDPASVKIPDDGHSWNVARVPSSDVLSAQLDHIDALPAPKDISYVIPRGKKYNTYDVAQFQGILDAAEKARDEVGQLGAKKRGVFSKSSQPRNRVVAGRFVAETYELGAAAIRAASVVHPLGGLAGTLDVAIGGKMSPNQAAQALPAANFLVEYLPRIRRDLGEYADNLREASRAVAKLRRYKLHPVLADQLARLAKYVEEGDEKLSKGKLVNPNLYANVLKSAASRP